MACCKLLSVGPNDPPNHSIFQFTTLKVDPTIVFAVVKDQLVDELNPAKELLLASLKAPDGISTQYYVPAVSPL